MMRSLVVFALAVAGVLAGAKVAPAQVIFSDGFESYVSGNPLPPQNGWTDFGGTQPILVSSTQAKTGLNSMRLSEATSGNYGSDVFRNFPGGVLNSGIYNFSYWQYIEPAVDTVAFMYISTGSMPTTFQTGLDLRADSPATFGFGTSMLTVQDVGGNPTLTAPAQALIKGAWVEYNMTINLGANQYDLFYNGVQIVNDLQWDTTPGDGVTFGGMNFWMQLGNANPAAAFVYYDDFTLTAVPEPSSLLLAPLGVALWKIRRRRAAAVPAI